MRLRGGLSVGISPAGSDGAHSRRLAPGTPTCDRSSLPTHHGTGLSEPTTLRVLARAARRDPQRREPRARTARRRRRRRSGRPWTRARARKGMIVLSERYFDRAMHKALYKMARPPHRLCRGTTRARLRAFLLYPAVCGGRARRSAGARARSGWNTRARARTPIQPPPGPDSSARGGETIDFSVAVEKAAGRL